MTVLMHGEVLGADDWITASDVEDRPATSTRNSAVKPGHVSASVS